MTIKFAHKARQTAANEFTVNMLTDEGDHSGFYGTKSFKTLAAAEAFIAEKAEAGLLA